MRYLIASLALVLGLCLTAADPRPDFGLPTYMNYVSLLSPSIVGSAAKGATATYNINVALAAYTVPANLTTSWNNTALINSGNALLQFTSNVTTVVNGLLAQITTYSADWYTPPSCIFSKLNASLDAAMDFVNQSSALVSVINGTTGNATATTINVILTIMGNSLQSITSSLDSIAQGVQNLQTAGTYSISAASVQIPFATAAALSAAIEQLVMAGNAFANVLTSVRLGFQNANTNVVSFLTQNSASQTAVNVTQASLNSTLNTMITTLSASASAAMTTINTALTGTLSSLSSFLIDSIVRTNATAAASTIVNMVTDVMAKTSEGQKNITTILTSVYTGGVTIIQNATSQITPVIAGVIANMSATAGTGGPNTATCNTIYAPYALEMNTRTTTVLQACINREITPVNVLVYTFNDYMAMLTAQFTAHVARLNQCFTFGTATSPPNGRSAVNTCLGAFVAAMNQTTADQTAQVIATNLVLEFEAFSMLQRMQNCANSGLNETISQAKSLNSSVTLCLTTGNK